VGSQLRQQFVQLINLDLAQYSGFVAIALVVVRNSTNDSFGFVKFFGEFGISAI